MANPRIRQVSTACKYLLGVAAVCVTLTISTPNSVNIPFISNKDIKCLADNIYHEARGEPYAGQVAVARVTLNRVAHSKYPDTICKVVYQRKQFSWTLNKSAKVKDKRAYLRAWHAAWHALLTPRGSTTHFHATYVKPKWSTKLTKVRQIGKHIFYHEPM